MSKTILITGGAGLLGSHLSKKLLHEGNKIICLDNLYTSHIRNINDLLKDKNFTFVNQDVCHPFYSMVDEIYNLACPASPIHYQKDPIFTCKTSVLGSINMLELALHCKAKIFQASTSEVYGDPVEHPQRESYWGNVNSVGIRSCYDEGKRCAETLFFDYYRKYGINIKVARFFNSYGPHMSPDDGRVVSNFIIQALQNKDITIYGEGKQTRSFCYVEDTVNGIIKLMNSDDNFHGPVNIGNPNEFTIFELAHKVIALTNSNSKIIYLPLPQDDPRQRQPDISLAKEKLQWEPKIQLDEGLKCTIAYFKELSK